MNFNILNVPIKTIVKRCSIASIGGLGCGYCAHNLKEHPGTTVKILKYAAVGGLIGGLSGYGIGVWIGRGALGMMLTQSMFASLTTAGYLSIRSAISNDKYTLPWRDEPINEMLVSSASGAITFGLITLLSRKLQPIHVLMGATFGMTFGFLGHLLYEKVRIYRLEFLLKENYGDLMSELKDAEEYMDEQQYSNPYYTGPVRAAPWSDYAKSVWHDFGKAKDGE